MSKMITWKEQYDSELVDVDGVMKHPDDLTFINWIYYKGYINTEDYDNLINIKNIFLKRNGKGD